MFFKVKQFIGIGFGSYCNFSELDAVLRLWQWLHLEDNFTNIFMQFDMDIGIGLIYYIPIANVPYDQNQTSLNQLKVAFN